MILGLEGKTWEEGREEVDIREFLLWILRGIWKPGSNQAPIVSSVKV